MWLNIFGSSSQPSYILFIYFSIYSFICFVHVIYVYVWVYEGWKYINAGVLHVYRSEVVLCYSSPYFYHLTYTEKEQLEKNCPRFHFYVNKPFSSSLPIFSHKDTKGYLRNRLWVSYWTQIIIPGCLVNELHGLDRQCPHQC